jgi:hypothetical protein
MPEPVIRIDHLSRSFGTITALDDLSLGVPAFDVDGGRKQMSDLWTMILVLLVAGVVVIQVLPARAISASQIWLIALVVLAVLDTIVLSISRVRFRRSHVIFF